MAERTELVRVPPRELARRGELAWAEDFLRDWLATKASTTLSNYRSDLEDFAKFMNLDGAAAAVAYLIHVGRGAARRAVVAYRAEMAGRPVWRSRAAQAAGEDPIRHGLAPRTINRRTAALSAVVKLAKDVERIDWELGSVPVYRVALIKDVTGVPRPDYLRMLLALDNEAIAARAEGDIPGEARARRDAAILRLLCDNGLRRKEVRGLDYPRDVDLDRGMVRVVGKGHTDATEVAIAKRTSDAIGLWMKLRGTEEGPLFLSFSNRGRGERPNLTSYNKIVARVAALAGVQCKVAPHRFRHSMVTRALDLTGGDVRRVQKISRHKNERTVLEYDDRRRSVERNLAERIASDEEPEEPS